jgi:hypothetical protein
VWPEPLDDGSGYEIGRILDTDVSPEFTRTSLLGEIYILSLDFLRRSIAKVWLGLVWLSVCLGYLTIYLALIPELISEQ